MANIEPAAIEVDRSNQAIFIAADIENDPIVDLIGRWESRPQAFKARELALPDNLVPAQERLFAIGIPFPKDNQSFARDHVHDLYNISF